MIVSLVSDEGYCTPNFISTPRPSEKEVYRDFYDVLHAYGFNVVSLRATSCDFGINNTLQSISTRFKCIGYGRKRE
jgi:hypothetical protein